MARDPNSFYQERQKQNREAQEGQMRGTMETYNLEKQNASGLPIPPIVVNILALIGLFAIFYVVLDFIF